MKATQSVVLITLVLIGSGVTALLARSRVNDAAVRGQRVGTAACLSCHSDQDTFTSTAHHLTSRVATGRSIEGSFQQGANTLRTSNPYLHFRMDSAVDGFAQTAVIGPEDGRQSHSESFDIVVGSGRKGQTYLSWADSIRLVQLPVSFWREVGWVNSPGYRDGTPNFGRPVIPRCLECHASYFETLSDDPTENSYAPDEAILGIGCETCHGAGAAHVRRQGSWTRWLLGAGIINPADLSRFRQIEACALCHAGALESRGRPFSYVPGDPVADHLRLSRPTEEQAVDVHGNQVALLTASPCFQGSDTMTCSTCHDTHQTQRNAAAFSDRCLGCHTVERCGLFPERGVALADNCVDCHMPRLLSNTVISTSHGDTLRSRVRTHFIKVYPTDSAH